MDWIGSKLQRKYERDDFLGRVKEYEEGTKKYNQVNMQQVKRNVKAQDKKERQALKLKKKVALRKKSEFKKLLKRTKAPRRLTTGLIGQRTGGDYFGNLWR